MKAFIPFFMITGLLLFIIDIIFYYEWRKYVLKNNWKKIYYKLLIFVSILMIFVNFLNNILRFNYPEPNIWTTALFATVAFWYLPKLPIVIFILIKHLYKLFKHLYLLIRKIFKHSSANEIKKERRKFVSDLAWLSSGVPFIITGYGIIKSAYDIRLHKVEIPFSNIETAHKGLKIVEIADLHTGSFYSLNPVKETVEIINSLKPDIIVVAGDFVNFNPNEYNDAVNILKKLKADIGIYACLGNHDHYMSNENHHKLKDMIKASNMDLLVNDNRILNIGNRNLNLAGVDNYGMKQSFGDFDKTLKETDPDAVTILLCHDPTNWDRFIRNKRKVELMLSGHTHGGQIGWEFDGFNLAPVSMAYKQWAGLYKDENQYLYINRGLGMTGPPIRLGMLPEITEIVLT